MGYDYDPKRQQEIQEWFDKQYGDRKERMHKLWKKSVERATKEREKKGE